MGDRLLKPIQTQLGLIYADKIVNKIKYFFLITKTNTIKMIPENVLKEELKEEGVGL